MQYADLVARGKLLRLASIQPGGIEDPGRNADVHLSVLVRTGLFENEAEVRQEQFEFVLLKDIVISTDLSLRIDQNELRAVRNWRRVAIGDGKLEAVLADSHQLRSLPGEELPLFGIGPVGAGVGAQLRQVVSLRVNRDAEQAKAVSVWPARHSLLQSGHLVGLHRAGCRTLREKKVGHPDAARELLRSKRASRLIDQGNLRGGEHYRRRTAAVGEHARDIVDGRFALRRGVLAGAAGDRQHQQCRKREAARLPLRRNVPGSQGRVPLISSRRREPRQSRAANAASAAIAGTAFGARTPTDQALGCGGRRRVLPPRTEGSKAEPS